MQGSRNGWWWLAGASVAVLLVGAAAPAIAQQRVSVRDLRLGFDRLYKNEFVEVHGWVSSERRVTSRTYKGFYVKDRFGDFLLVRTTQALPDINAELDVKGVALRDADTADIYLTETTRAVVPQVVVPGGRQGGTAAGGATSGTAAAGVSSGAGVDGPTNGETNTAGGTGVTRTRVLIGLGFAIAALVGLAVFMLARRRQPVPEAALAGAGWSAPASVPDIARQPDVPGPMEYHSAPAGGSGFSSMDDYRTVKVYKTTKVLPGSLFVIENKQETDLILLTDQSGRGEIEIGRDSPDVTGGIRIKDRTNTLSRRQARITYTPGSRQFRLVNLAGDSANPTILNACPMGEGESALLKDGDMMMMGNVEMKFRQK